VSRRESASRSSSSKNADAHGPRVGRDGKVEISCPQCGAGYRVAPEKLDSKIECGDCHRVFFAKTTAGKRAKPPSYTKVYVGFGIGAIALVGLFMMMSKGNDGPKTPSVVAAAPKAPAHSRGNHPRTAQLVKWGQAVGSGNQLVLNTHSDMAALAKAVGLADGKDGEAVLKALQTHEMTRFLRELDCDSGELATDADMTADNGTGTLYVTPKSGDATYAKNANGRLAVTFKMDGEQVKVTGLSVALPPVRMSGSDPNAKTLYPINKDIAKPEMVEITDSAGTRKVRQSKPAPVPHYGKATPEQQKLADDVVAGLLASADPEAPGKVFNNAVDRIKSIDERKAVVPRVLNAMYELHGDVNTNNQKLSQLNRALVTFTGFAVNYQVEPSEDPAKDKAARESCVSQWFAFWYKYSENFEEFYNQNDPMAEEPEADDKAKKAPASSGGK
jgi:ribosomal protein S27AE